MRGARIFSKSITLTLVLLLGIVLCLSVLITGNDEYVYADVYGYPNINSGSQEFFVPGNFTNTDADGFPSAFKQYSKNQGSTLITKDKYSFGSNLDLNNFDALGRNGAPNSVQGDQNYMQYEGAFNTANRIWKYIYGYIELPDHLTNNGGTIYVSADTAGYNSGNNSSVKYLSIAASRKLYGRDEGPKKDKFNATDLELNKTTWRTSAKSGVHKGMTDGARFNTQRQYVGIDIKPNEKYVRISYISMCQSNGNDGYGFKIANVQLHDGDVPDEYDFARPNNRDDFVPGGNVNWNNFTLTEFSSGINKNYGEGATLLPNTKWNTSSTIDLNYFNTTGREPLNGNAEGHSDGIFKSATEIRAQAKSSNNGGDLFWRYMYGYVELPKALTRYGGTLTVSAITVGTFNCNNTGRKMLSLVTGDYLDQNKTSHLNATDLHMNKSRGRSSIEQGSQTTFDYREEAEQTVTISVKPGDKIARVSYIFLYKENPDEHNGVGTLIGPQNYVGSRIKNVRLNYNADDYDAPILSSIQGKNDLAYSSKEISITVNDISGIKNASLKLGDTSIALTKVSSDLENATYKFTANTQGEYRVTITDNFDNTITTPFQIGDFLTADNGVSIEIVDPARKIANISIINKDWTRNIVQPDFVNAKNVREVNNYGNSALYEVTFDTAVDCTQNIVPKYESIKMTILDDGKKTKVQFGELYTFKTQVVEGKDFVGWQDEHGVIVSPRLSFEWKAVRNIALTPVFVQDDIIKVKYTNLSGNTIAIETYPSGDIGEILANTSIKAPVNPFMTFARWINLGTDSDGYIEARASYNRENITFTVTILYADYSAKTIECPINEKITVHGKTKSATGWRVSGKKVTNSDELELYVTSNLSLTEIPYSENITDTVITTISTDDRETVNDPNDDILVVSGVIAQGVKYDEIGILFADPKVIANGSDVNLYNKMVFKVPIYNVTKTNQFMVALSRQNFFGKWARIYMVNNSGNITYLNAFKLQEVA